MANVLPSHYKRSLWRAQRARYIVILSIAFAALAAVGVVALAPSYLALEIASPQPIDIPETNRESAPDPLAVARANALVAKLAGVYATSSPTELFGIVLAVRGKGIAIDSISYSGSDSRITVSGRGPRENISAYKDALSANPLFSEVSVPVGALVGSDNGAFSITITLL